MASTMPAMLKQIPSSKNIKPLQRVERLAGAYSFQARLY
jgi:hypothetical protein